MVDLLAWLLDEKIPQETRSKFLILWAKRGESPEEISALATLLRDRALKVNLPEKKRVIDVCGTGGDGRQMFNVSTAVAFALAGAGFPVAKHGNRGLTSKSGGFDVVEKLGVKIPHDPASAEAQFSEHGLCFLFAPHFHPAFAAIAPLRKQAAALGSRTVFNLMGPLLNPAQPGRQLLGISEPSLLDTYASTLRLLGVSPGMVVCGKTSEGAPMDEVSLIGATLTAEWHSLDEPVSCGIFSAQGLGIKTVATDADFTVNSPEESASVLEGVLSGRDQGVRMLLVAINLAAALKICGNYTWLEAFTQARDILKSGAGWRKVCSMRS